MPLVFRYSDPGGAEEPAVMTDLGNTVTGVRLGTLAIGQSAEIGEGATSGIEIDDPEGTLDLQGYRTFRIEETSAPSNSRWIFNGVIGDQRISRGGSDRPSLRLDTARVWSIDLLDRNWSLGVSIITGADGNRPAETAGERLRWVIANYSRVKDFGHVTYPSDQMDACDYRHQTVKDVVADCALPGGYNYWADWPEAQVHAELFFMLPTSSSYATTISISNVLADVNNTTVFAPAMEAELYRSPSRITYGVDLQYDGGSRYDTNPTTGAQFAYVDRSAPLANVKSSTKAGVIAARFLADNDEQDERVTVSIKVPAAQVNDVRHGHRMNNVTFTHLPGWWQRDCRVMRRTVIQELAGGEAWYRIDLELSPIEGPTYEPWACPLDAGIGGTAAGTYPPTDSATNTQGTGNIWYTRSNANFFDSDSTIDFTDGPQPGRTDMHGLGFPDYGATGGDAGGVAVSSVVGFVFAGPGTIEASWVNYDGTYTITWWVQYKTLAGVTTEDSGSIAAPGTLTVTVPDLPADATNCYRFIQMRIDNSGTGSKGTFAGLTWTPA